MRRGRFFATVAVCATALASTLVTSNTAAQAATSPNLIKNPGAEAGPGSSTGEGPTAPSWKRSTGKTFTAVKYGVSGFPDSKSPGPSNRGKNFFAGGTDTSSKEIATQTISLSSYAAKIKTGKVKAAVAGWFGGFSSQADDAKLEVDFKSSSGKVVGSISIGSVTAAQRHNVTGLVQRTGAIGVPKTATTAYVQLIMTRVDGAYNDGYADNLSLNLNGV